MGSKNFIVGLFVATALAIFLGASIWLAGQQGGRATVTYSMFFEKDVSGLMLGGPVYYLGVEVGNVTRMEIILGDPMSVRVDIEVLENTPVDTGTSASLAFQGITGVAVINLVGDPGMNLPLKTPPGHEYPVIEVRDTGLAAVLSDAPAIVEKLNNLLDQANALIGEGNRSRVARTLQNIDSLSGSLAAREESFAELPDSLNRTLADIRDSLQSVQEAIGDMRPGLASTVANLEQLSTSLGSLAARLDRWTAENSADMQDFMSGGLGQVPELVGEAREALREIEKLLRELREDPSSLIYQPDEDPVVVDQ
ncbi:MAG: MCE family protein [Xanthomonadales bacterium]|nr:MCE family protein [Xanthomonadales bacterium]NIX11905.1 MCE family protein [Xanthomonadales bacterium]